MKLITVFILLNFSILSPADAAQKASKQCDSVRLDQGIMRTIPVSDQGKDSTCSYESGLQLYDAWRFSHGETDLQKTSSNENAWFQILATHLPLSDLEEMVYGSKPIDIRMGTELPPKMRSCSGRALQKVLGGRVGPFVYRIHEAVLLNQEYWTQNASLGIDEIRKNIHQSRAITNLQMLMEGWAINPQASKIILQKFETAFAAGPKLYDPTKTRGFTESEFIQNEILPILCEGDIIQPNSRIKFHSVPLPGGILEKRIKSLGMLVDASLCVKNPQPLYIGVCSNFLTGKKECGPHAMTLVGKRKSKNQTEFLLKNSWGLDWCKGNKDKSLKFEENCNVWVPEKILARKGVSSGLGWIPEEPATLCGTLSKKEFDGYGTEYSLTINKSTLNIALVLQNPNEFKADYASRVGKKVCVKGTIQNELFAPDSISDFSASLRALSPLDVESIYLQEYKH